MEKQSHKKVSSGQGLSVRSAVRAGKNEINSWDSFLNSFLVKAKDKFGYQKLTSVLSETTVQCKNNPANGSQCDEWYAKIWTPLGLG